MGEMRRRDIVGLLALAPAAVAFSWTSSDVLRASRRLAERRPDTRQFQPQFFTAHEYEIVRVLVDLILPRDARSGSATDAGVPEFMDFMMIDQPGNQIRMRGGLAWLNTECVDRFGTAFLDCTDDQRRSILNDIAWPARAPAELRHGVAFFNSFRDLTATGFWSSKMGVADLQYMGNTVVAEWTGCPEEQLRKLGVRYE
jgi:hypothetical protein